MSIQELIDGVYKNRSVSTDTLIKNLNVPHTIIYCVKFFNVETQRDQLIQAFVNKKDAEEFASSTELCTVYGPYMYVFFNEYESHLYIEERTLI